MLSGEQIDAVAKRLAQREFFDWATLPVLSDSLPRDRTAFREIARDLAEVIEEHA